MKLSSMYTNEPQKFERIDFKAGLNVIKADIRLPGNLEKDTHNLGKTAFGSILDFCLIGKYLPEFIKSNKELFASFVFFLEIELDDGSFLTLKRSVETSSKVSFKKHTDGKQDLSTQKENPVVWDHEDLPYQKAKSTLDAYLKFEVLKPWDYRALMSYLIRSQDDYGEIFLQSNNKGPERNWKPFLAHLLGYNSDLIEQKYALNETLDALNKDIASKINKLGIVKTRGEDTRVIVNRRITEIDNALVIATDELEEKNTQIESFNFDEIDKDSLNTLVDDIDSELVTLNEKSYSLLNTKKRIEESLGRATISFDPKKAEKLFQEVKILFPDQLKKDFSQLIEFNKDITIERDKYLRVELEDIIKKLGEISDSRFRLNNQRSEILSGLTESDVFEKYKLISKRVTSLEVQKLKIEADLAPLNEVLADLDNEGVLTSQLNSLIERILENVRTLGGEKDSKIQKIQSSFNKIVSKIIDDNAYLTVTVNQNGNLQFDGYIKNENNEETSKGKGYSYKRFLCLAFDFSLLKSYLHDNFARFTYHDSIFDGSDDRKKEKILSVLRDLGHQGLQPIISVIDSEIPAGRKDTFFYPEEVILLLHDDGEQGRLFKMDSW